MNDLVDFFINQGFLVSPKSINEINEENKKTILQYLKNLKEKPLLINKDIINLAIKNKQITQIKWNEFEKSLVLFEKDKDKLTYETFLKILDLETNKFSELNKEQEFISKNTEINDLNEEPNVVILKNYAETSKKYTVQDFTNYFKLRYDKLKSILISRKELQNTISINRILNKFNHEEVSIIGIVNEKRLTKNGNLLLVIEDQTGLINIIFNKNKPELFETANDTLLDEIVGITGQYNDRMVFAKNIYFPDIPINNPLKKAEKEEYAVFTSDLQIGSKVFYEKNLLNFIDWLNCNHGNKEQKEVAKKVKYLFIPGDLVEGVGVYPGQEEDLMIADIYKQYEKFVEYISKIRKDIKIIISPGNHDAVRLAEPQPKIDEKMAKRLYELENIYLTTNPAVVNISSTKDNPGLNVLIYHGFSFPYIAENVESIRKSGRLENPELILKYLLQRRHLAPSHTSTQYMPYAEEDPLLIEKIPDFIISGHIHKTKVMNYRNVTLMNCSCWISQTEDQERRGIKPDPCKAILVNLKTREIKILNFMET